MPVRYPCNGALSLMPLPLFPASPAAMKSPRRRCSNVVSVLALFPQMRPCATDSRTAPSQIARPLGASSGTPSFHR